MTAWPASNPRQSAAPRLGVEGSAIRLTAVVHGLAPGNIPLAQALHERFDFDLLLGQRPPDHARRLKLPLHLPEQRPLRWGGVGCGHTRSIVTA